MEKEKVEKFRKMLEKKLQVLQRELSRIGRINPDNKDDWEAKPEEWDKTGADWNELSDVIEEYEENSAALKELEIRYNNVKRALKKIENGTYGLDEVDGTPIPQDRLLANPSARTKVENADKLR